MATDIIEHEAAAAVEGDALSVWAGVFFGLALFFALMGIGTMYAYSDGLFGGGGDAVHYLILATRGVGWLVAGVASAIVGGTCAVVSAIRRAEEARARRSAR